MANICSTSYVVVAEISVAEQLWNTLCKLGLPDFEVSIPTLLAEFGIDYQQQGIYARGTIYDAQYSPNREAGIGELFFYTQTAWHGCHDAFHAVNKVLDDAFAISYMEVEYGCGIFFIHDEANYFGFTHFVCATGDEFPESEGPYECLADAVFHWCDTMGIEQGNRTDEEMMEFINDYKYESEETYFHIYPFEFE